MLAAANSSKDIWYLMRGTGFVTLLLFTLTVVGGIVNVKRYARPGWPRLVTALLHRNVALLSVVFLAIHILTAELDSYVKIGWLAAVVPFTSGWKPMWVGLGALAVDCLLAIVVTSLIRSRLSHRLWRAVHWLAYVSWPLAVAHGFGSGTDSATAWARAIYVLSIGVVALAVGWRLLGKATAIPTPAPALVRPAAARPRTLVRTGAQR
jgi:methionine sulfoxide reductase heme-binding subunit